MPRRSESAHAGVLKRFDTFHASVRQPDFGNGKEGGFVRRSTVWIAVALALGAVTAQAQFRKILKSAGKQVEDAARGTALGGAESGKPQAGPPVNQGSQPPGAAASAGAAGAPQKPKEIRPGLVVDEAVVAAQAERFLARCRETPTMASNGIDCTCGAAQYPQIRLELLSELIANHERMKELQCGSPMGCKRWTDAYNRMNSPEFQKSYEPRPDSTALSLAQRPACRNYTAVVEQKEQECLANPEHYQLRPGQSTKTFCGCLKSEFAKLLDGGGFDGSKQVHAISAAASTCQQKTGSGK